MKERQLISLLLVAAFATGIFGGCEDLAVEPEPEHYNMYVAALDWIDGTATDPLYILDAESMDVIDTIPQVGSLRDLEVSPDGKWLYAYVHRGSPGSHFPLYDSLRCIDVQKKQVAWAIPSGLSTSITILDNGKLILRRWSQFRDEPGGQDLIDASTGTVLKTLPVLPWCCEGPETGTKVAATLDVKARPGASRIVALDVVSGEQSGSLILPPRSGYELRTAYVRLHPDRETVLLMAGIEQDFAWAMIGNLRTGTVESEQWIPSLWGEGAFSSDGQWAVFSDTDNNLRSVNLQTHEFVGTTPARGGAVRFVGTSQSVISAGRPDYWSTDPIYQVDLLSSTVTQRKELPLPEPLIGAFCVGRRP